MDKTLVHHISECKEEGGPIFKSIRTSLKVSFLTLKRSSVGHGVLASSCLLKRKSCEFPVSLHISSFVRMYTMTH